MAAGRSRAARDSVGLLVRTYTCASGRTAVGPTNLKAAEAEESLVGRHLDEEAIVHAGDGACFGSPECARPFRAGAP